MIAAILAVLRTVASRLFGFSALAAIGRALKWFFTGTFLEIVIKRVVVWAALMAVAGPLVKAVKITSMLFVYYIVLRIIGWLGIDPLIEGFVQSLDLLPAQAVCGLKLLGFGDVVRLFLSTASTVGTIKILLRLAGS
jgi:hypothetical protein